MSRLDVMPCAWNVFDGEELVGSIKRTLFGFEASYMGRVVGSFPSLRLATQSVHAAHGDN